MGCCDRCAAMEPGLSPLGSTPFFKSRNILMDLRPRNQGASLFWHPWFPPGSLGQVIGRAGERILRLETPSRIDVIGAEKLGLIPISKAGVGGRARARTGSPPCGLPPDFSGPKSSHHSGAPLKTRLELPGLLEQDFICCIRRRSQLGFATILIPHLLCSTPTLPDTPPDHNGRRSQTFRGRLRRRPQQSQAQIPR